MKSLKVFRVGILDFEYGCWIIVARTVPKAKAIAMRSDEIDCDYIDLRVRKIADSVTDLPEGIVEDYMECLKRGWYSVIMEEDCPICGRCSDVYYRNGTVGCETCLEEKEIKNEIT